MSGRRWLDGVVPDGHIDRLVDRMPDLDSPDTDAALTAAVAILGGQVVMRAESALPRLAEALVARADLRRREGRVEQAAEDIELAVRTWGFLAEELDDLPPGIAAAAGLPRMGPSAQATATALRATLDAPAESWLPGLVLALVGRSNVESAQGRAGPAMVSAEAAHERARWLVEAWSDDCQKHLAATLGALSDRYEEVGNLDGALAHRQAQIAAVDLTGDAGALGEAWNRLAQLRARRGEGTDALEAFARSARHVEALAVESPARWGVARALALENRVKVAEHLRLAQVAADAAREAADAWLSLGAMGEPRYACCLSHLADACTELGQREAALDAAQQAASIAADLPEHALSLEDRIWILNAWSRALSDLGRREDALKVSHEQVRMLRIQEASQDSIPHPQLALSLVNLAIDLKQLGRGGEALAAAREGTGRMRAIAADDPHVRADLAAALVELSNCSGWAGRLEDALEQVQEAHQLFCDLSAEGPGRFDSDIAMTLANEGGLWWRRGDLERALPLMIRAADISRELAEDSPQQHGPMLATLLANLAGALADDDQPERSLQAVEESVAVHRSLAAQLPHAFTRGLALALNNLGGTMFELDRYDESLAAFVEAEVLLERAGIEGYRGVLGELRSNRAACLLELDDAAAALAPAADGVEQQRQEFAVRPDAARARLARVLSVQGTARVRAGQGASGLKDLEEALDLLVPELLRNPAAAAELWEWVGARYVEACESTGTPPDADRLTGGGAIN